MWDLLKRLPWPLSFKRQYAQPLDYDAVFETLADMQTYLTDPVRYQGQVATCLESEGKIYHLNATRDAWVEISGGGGSAESDVVLESDYGNVGVLAGETQADFNAAIDGFILAQNEANAGFQSKIPFVTETNNEFLRDDGTFQVIEMPVGGYANNLYFNEAASDVSGYETLSYTPEVNTTIESWIVNASEGEKVLKSYLYPSQVGVNYLNSGLWSFQFYGKVSASNGITNLGVQYFRRLADNSEVNLFTLWSDEINNTSDAWIKISMTLPGYNLDTTDRMGCRVLARTTHNQNITITYAVGDGYGAWINNPNKIRHSQLRALNEDLTAQHIDSNSIYATIRDADRLGFWDNVLSKFVTVRWDSVRSLISGLFRLVTATGDEHGFDNPPNASNFQIANTGSSVTLNLLANAGTYKINGTPYVNNGLTLTFTASLGQNFIVITSQGLQVGSFDIMDKTKIHCCIVEWGGTLAIVNDELHDSRRNLLEHKKQHDTDGCRYVGGLNTTFGSSANNTFNTVAGSIRDEDRYHIIGARTVAMIGYRHSSLNYMVYDEPSTRFCKLVGTTTGAPYYDNAGVLTAISDGNYGTYWMYATNRKLYSKTGSANLDSCELLFVMGQAQYTSVANAQAAARPTLPVAVAEWNLLYRVIVRNVGGALVFTQADPFLGATTGPANSGSGLSLASVAYSGEHATLLNQNSDPNFQHLTSAEKADLYSANVVVGDLSPTDDTGAFTQNYQFSVDSATASAGSYTIKYKSNGNNYVLGTSVAAGTILLIRGTVLSANIYITFSRR